MELYRSARTSYRRAIGGMTTIETLIAIGISMMLLTQISALWFYSTRSFAAQASYTKLDQDSQRALDRLSRDVRQATNLVSFTTNRLVLTGLDGQPMEFRLLGRNLVKDKGASHTTLLTDCDWLSFAMYQRTPVSNSFDQYITTDVATCKLIEVRWKCSRRPYPTSPDTTEYMQSAKVVLRSK
jgi:Tfp pilus assembly protein PilW